MKISKHELLEQLHEQGIIINVLQSKIDTYKREIEVYKTKRNKKITNFDKKIYGN